MPKLSKTGYIAIFSNVILASLYLFIKVKGMDEFLQYPMWLGTGILVLVLLSLLLSAISLLILLKRSLDLDYWVLFVGQGLTFVIANKFSSSFIQTAADLSFFGLDVFFHFLITNDIYADWFVTGYDDNIVKLTALGIVLRLVTCFIYGYSLDLLSIKIRHRRLEKMKYDYYVNDIQQVGEQQSFDDFERYFNYLTTLDNEIEIDIYEGEIYFDLVNIESFDVEYTEDNELRLTNLKKNEST